MAKFTGIKCRVRKLAADDRDILRRVHQRNMMMPNGGAVLSVLADGAISNGMFILTRFRSRQAAYIALRQCGFKKVWNGFKAI